MRWKMKAKLRRRNGKRRRFARLDSSAVDMVAVSLLVGSFRKKAKDKKDKKEKKEKKDSNKKHADANQNKKRRTADEGKGENAPDAAAAGVTGRPGSSGDKILVAPKEELRQPQEAEEAQEAQEAEEAEEADEDGLEAEDVDDEMPEKAPAPPLDAASGLRGLPAAASVSTIPQPVRASAMVLSGSEDGTVRLWDLELETKCIRVLEGHMGTVHSLTVSWDTFEAVSGADDSSKLWNLKLGGCQKTMTEIPEGCTAVEADWRGRRALAGCGDGSLRVWSMSTAELQTTLQAHRGGVWALQADFEHKKLVSAGDENFKVWDVSDWTCLRTSEGHAGGLMCVSVNWTKSQLLAGAGSSTKRLQLWNLDSETCQKSMTSIWFHSIHGRLQPSLGQGLHQTFCEPEAPGGEKTRTDAEPDVLQGRARPLDSCLHSTWSQMSRMQVTRMLWQ